MAAMYAFSRGVVGPSVVFASWTYVQAVLDHFCVRIVPELVPQAHGFAPTGHDTVGIISSDVLEFLSRLLRTRRSAAGLRRVRRASALRGRRKPGK
jgi:hypothetical protein